ncbi:hypothetical protein [Klebsiella variicola]|uniref:hypothetical protein n=1 Tax=Klebsiella variicola TaxID=244366 RepID=UPI00355BB481
MEIQERRKVDREPVAEVVSIYGDPEAFGEREIRPLVGIQQMPYGTKLYRHAQPVVEIEPVAEVISNRPGNDTSTIDRALPVGTQLYRHAQPAPEYPETLPCPVLLEPGLRFGKGIKTSTMLSALARRAVHESDMAALSQEERAEFQARIEDFKALIAQPAPSVPDERDKTVDADDHPLLWSFNAGWNACRAAMLQTKSLTSINPAPDLVSLQKKAESIIGNYPGIPDCWCRTCRPVVLNDMRFVVCPDCGNKRCPRANDHRNACTGSNEPGQQDSAYPDTPQEVKP